MHPKATDRQKGYLSQVDQDRISHLQTRRYAILISYKCPSGSKFLSVECGPGRSSSRSKGARKGVERRNAKTGQCRRGPKCQAGRFPQAFWGHLVLPRHGQVKFGAAQRQPKLAPKHLQLWSGVLLVLLKPLPHEVARGAPDAHDRS